MNNLQSDSLVKIIEGIAAFALVGGLLIALGETALFPVAIGVLVLALLWWLIKNGSKIGDITALFNRAGAITSGQSQPNVGGSSG